MSLVERIKIWYRGKYVPPPPNDPNSTIFIISPGYYEQPALAKLLRVLGQSWLSHWKWIVATIIAVISIAVSLFKK